MLRHDLLIILRNFLRFKSSFLINLFGLSTGLGCALLIYLWVKDEWQKDKFHEHDSRLVQVMWRNEDARGIAVGPEMPPVLAETLLAELPEAERAVNEAVVPMRNTLTVGNRAIKVTGMYADRDYFEVFSYPLVEGKPADVLADESSIVISESAALKLFNTTRDLSSKVISFEDKGDYLVSGIFADPVNASIHFDFILPFQAQFKHYPNLKEDWSNSWTNTHLLLKEGSDIEAVNTKIKDIVKDKTGQEGRTLFVRPFSDGYLHNKYENGVQSGGRIEYVKLFSIIAVFIILIACINFMNLSTARATTRLKEVAIKKTIGAGRKTLIRQFMGESLLLTLVAVCCALGIVGLSLPQFNQITGKDLTLTLDLDLIVTLGCIAAATGLISGSYPSLYLSGFNPVAILKGNLRTSFGELLTRKGLIAFQFILSVILIVAVIVVYRQMEFIQNKNMGYSKDNIIYFDMEGKVKEHREAFLAEVRKLPGVSHASSMFRVFFGDLNSTSDIAWEGSTTGTDINMQYRRVNYDMIELLGIQMVAGASFSRDVNAAIPKIIFNETAIDLMGVENPVGKTITLWGREMEIAGVAKDFHFQSVHENIKPLFFFLNPERTNTIMIKMESGDMKRTLATLQSFYSNFTEGSPLDFGFLDAEFQAQYLAETRVSTLSRYFAGLAIVISCLGLFGVVIFVTARKTKEISIRKICGAGHWRIVTFLSAEFTRTIVVAIVIALPISYFVVRQWLDGFAYRIDLRWEFFMASGMIALLIAWLTISVQAIRAARANPIKNLRSE